MEIFGNSKFWVLPVYYSKNGPRAKNTKKLTEVAYLF